MGPYRNKSFQSDFVKRPVFIGGQRRSSALQLQIARLFLGFGVLTHSRCKRENQNASNSAAFNEIATSQQLLLSRLPLGFAAFDQRPCFLPDTRSWRFMPAPKVRKTPKSGVQATPESCFWRKLSK